MGFRENLIKLRDDNRLSQQELADMLDVSRQTVSRWESGKSTPSANQISNICNVFHINANDLIDTRSPDNPQKDVSASEPDKKSKNYGVTLCVILCILLAVAVAGLIATVVYAVKDAAYDSSATVWIVSIPQNTPMIVLSVFLALFIIVLTVLLIFLLRRTKK